jgi:hypothetical protein
MREHPTPCCNGQCTFIPRCRSSSRPCWRICNRCNDRGLSRYRGHQARASAGLTCSKRHGIVKKVWFSAPRQNFRCDRRGALFANVIWESRAGICTGSLSAVNLLHPIAAHFYADSLLGQLQRLEGLSWSAVPETKGQTVPHRPRQARNPLQNPRPRAKCASHGRAPLLCFQDCAPAIPPRNP